MDNKIRKFMYGRYGVDELYKFEVVLYFICLFLNIFLNNIFLNIFILFLLLSITYRMFSRKIYRRSRENKIYLGIRNKLVSPFINIKRNIKDKDHVYKRCLKCKTILKLPLPNKRGINHAKCPNCGNRVTLFTLKSQKIEIITKNGTRRI